MTSVTARHINSIWDKSNYGLFLNTKSQDCILLISIGKCLLLKINEGKSSSKLCIAQAPTFAALKIKTNGLFGNDLA